MCCIVEFIGTHPIVFSNVLALTASGHFVPTQLLKLISIGFTMSRHPRLLLKPLLQISNGPFRCVSANVTQ